MGAKPTTLVCTKNILGKCKQLKPVTTWQNLLWNPVAVLPKMMMKTPLYAEDLGYVFVRTIAKYLPQLHGVIYKNEISSVQ